MFGIRLDLALMFDSRPIFCEIEARTMVFHVAFLTGLGGIWTPASFWILCVVPTRAVTDFALDVGQPWCVDFTDETARLIECDGMTGQTLRVECLVDLFQRRISFAVTRLPPDFVSFRMTRFTGGLGGINRFFRFISPNFSDRNQY